MFVDVAIWLIRFSDDQLTMRYIPGPNWKVQYRQLFIEAATSKLPTIGVIRTNSSTGGHDEAQYTMVYMIWKRFLWLQMKKRRPQLKRVG